MENVSGDKNEISDDPVIHLERFQESQRKRMKLMEDKKEKLQKEIDTMNSVFGEVASANNKTSNDNDIIEINAGGIIITALRSTLCLVAFDTMFSYMFSGRWDESLARDKDGRIFLDHDPELITIIVNYLRTKKIEDQSKPVRSPKIPDGKKDEFETILQYFGLTEFFYPPSIILPLDIDIIDVVQPAGSYATVAKTENKIQFLKSGIDGTFHFVACKPALDSSGEGSFWKVTIDALRTNYKWLYLGIIGNLAASNGSSHTNSTSYGWASNSQVYHGGTNRSGDSGWTGFTQGECLYLHLKANKLTMFSVQKNKKFTMDVATTGTYYLHFNTPYTGTTWTLEPLRKDERTRLL